MPIYLCPSDPQGPLSSERTENKDEKRTLAGQTPATRFGRSNYVVSSHDAALTGNLNEYRDGVLNKRLPVLLDGVAFCNSKVKFKDITDGTGSTLLAGERVDAVTGGGRGTGGTTEWGPNQGGFVMNIAPINPASAVWAGTNKSGYVNPDSYTAGNLHRGMVWSAASAHYSINDFSTVDASKGYSSNHPGGALFVFADGAVRLLNQDIDATTFKRLANRRDGKVVGAY